MAFKPTDRRIRDFEYTKMEEKDFLRPSGTGKPLMTPTEWATLCKYRRTFNK